MDPSAGSPTKSSKNFLVIGLVVITVVLMIATGYLFMNSQSLSRENETLTNKNTLLQTQVSSLKDEKAQLEKDLIYYKNTDLAKEVEILNLKLKTADEGFATTKAALDKLKIGVSSIPEMTSIASKMMTTFGKNPPNCFGATDKASINQELNAFGDREWIGKWEDFISGTDSKNCSMSPDKLENAVNYGLTKISDAVK